MATTLSDHPRVAERNIIGNHYVLTGTGTRLLRRGSDALAQAIDLSLTVMFLLADLVLAASLAATAAGLAASPPA